MQCQSHAPLAFVAPLFVLIINTLFQYVSYSSPPSTISFWRVAVCWECLSYNGRVLTVLNSYWSLILQLFALKRDDNAVLSYFFSLPDKKNSNISDFFLNSLFILIHSKGATEAQIDIYKRGSWVGREKKDIYVFFIFA